MAKKVDEWEIDSLELKVGRKQAEMQGKK